jgi:hypothetical protein
MFKAGYRLNLANLPDQWRRKTPVVAPNPKRNNEQTANNGAGQNKRHGSNPFQAAGDNQGPARVKPNPPNAFKSEDFKKLREKFRQLTLTEIAQEAGIRGGPSKLDVTGWPQDGCLNWLCMGICKRSNCRNNHPASVDDAASQAVYKQLEPGIKHLLENGKCNKWQ